jgi:RNA polymerase sigma-70 factor, ECF subfamily
MSALNAVPSQSDNWFLPYRPRVGPPIEPPGSITPPLADREDCEQHVQSSLLNQERLLIRRVIASDDGAFEELIAKHVPRLRQIAYNLLRNREDAEEAVQDALLSAYRNLKSFRGQSLFSTWLTRIVINAARMVRRKNSGRPECSLDEILAADPRPKIAAVVDPRHDPEQACEAAEIGELIDEGFRRLSPHLQEAFRLREIEGLSTDACLAILGIQRSAFKSRVTRARHRLASALRPMLLSAQAQQFSAGE